MYTFSEPSLKAFYRFMIPWGIFTMFIFFIDPIMRYPGSTHDRRARTLVGGPVLGFCFSRFFNRLGHYCQSQGWGWITVSSLINLAIVLAFRASVLPRVFAAGSVFKVIFVCVKRDQPDHVGGAHLYHAPGHPSSGQQPPLATTSFIIGNIICIKKGFGRFVLLTVPDQGMLTAVRNTSEQTPTLCCPHDHDEVSGLPPHIHLPPPHPSHMNGTMFSQAAFLLMTVEVTFTSTVIWRDNKLYERLLGDKEKAACAAHRATRNKFLTTHITMLESTLEYMFIVLSAVIFYVCDVSLVGGSVSPSEKVSPTIGGLASDVAIQIVFEMLTDVCNIFGACEPTPRTPGGLPPYPRVAFQMAVLMKQGIPHFLHASIMRFKWFVPCMLLQAYASTGLLLQIVLTVTLERHPGTHPATFIFP
jgi:hypothetical protein